MLRAAVVSTVLAAALVSSVGCSKAPSDKAQPEDAGGGPPAYGDALIQGSIGDASTLIIMLASDSASHEVAGQLFDGLLTYDKDLKELEPRLAERWEVSDDGLQITFHLRHDVKWQDGQPFDVHDVKFGFDTIRDPATLTSYAEDFKQVERFEVLDDYTFRVTYEKPFAPALASWSGIVVLPKHLLEGKNINDTPFSRNPVGLGAYRFESWEPQTKISVRSNHDYYRGRPYIERITWRIIPDLATQFLELKSGGLDLMGLTPLQFQRQTSSAAFLRDFKKYKYVANGYTYLGYNLRRPLFQDARVRRAMTHAIDRKEIVDAVLLGLGRPIEGPYKPGTVWVNDALRPLSYDPDRSRALLAEAGWSDSDGDGVVDKDGKAFEFEITTNNGNEQRLKAATMIQERLKEVGIRVTIRPLEWSAFLGKVDRRDFDAVLLGWTMGPDPDQYDIWHSSKTEGRNLNFIGFKNAEVDALLEKGRRTFDPVERKKAYDRFQEILTREQPYTFLYVGDALVAVQSRFHGIVPAPSGIGYNLEKWYVPSGQQRYTISEGP